MSAAERWAVLVEEVNGRRGYYSQHVRDPEFPCDAYDLDLAALAAVDAEG